MQDVTETQAKDLRACVAAAVRILQRVLDATEIGHEQLAQAAVVGAAVNDTALAILDALSTTGGEPAADGTT